MDEIIDYLLSHPEVIIAAFSFVMSVIIIIITAVKKYKGDVMLIVKESLVRVLPQFINTAEALIGFGNGEDKKAHVISLALSWCKNLLGRSLTEEEATSFISYTSEQVEAILSTPEKKEG